MILALLVLAATAVRSVGAQQDPRLSRSPAPPTRVGLSAAIGVSWPADDVVAGVYGNVLPITVQGDVRVFRHVAVFGGFRSAWMDGQSIVLDPALTDERYPTSLHVSSLRVGATVAVPVSQRFTAAGSIGFAVNWFEERWPYAQASASGHPTGVVVQGEMRVALNPRWSAVGRGEYAPISTHIAGTSGTTAVNLGGFDVSAGIRMSF